MAEGPAASAGTLRFAPLHWRRAEVAPTPSSTLRCFLAPTGPVWTLLPLTCSNDHFPLLPPPGCSPPHRKVVVAGLRTLSLAQPGSMMQAAAHPPPGSARISGAGRSTPPGRTGARRPGAAQPTACKYGQRRQCRPDCDTAPGGLTTKGRFSLPRPCSTTGSFHTRRTPDIPRGHQVPTRYLGCSSPFTGSRATDTPCRVTRKQTRVEPTEDSSGAEGADENGEELWEAVPYSRVLLTSADKGSEVPPVGIGRGPSPWTQDRWNGKGRVGEVEVRSQTQPSPQPTDERLHVLEVTVILSH
ncbi:hypothetical protein NDU88_003529 [Pleurodeles waltl]|uniref:Uncharacterized protein n=1 Tax=Pleurodeles waltl TaxID=8319 RepID=A0AAV7SDV9_PLEWA|nr:hypothetical protein NDU88_003529 [Pleurodeles waltl]